MKNLQDIDTRALLAMLARYVSTYGKLMRDGTKDEVEECKATMVAIQDELNLRKQAENN